MSGPIRSKLGPNLKRLKTSIENVEEILAIKENYNLEQLNTLKNERHMITRALEIIEPEEEKWSSYISKLAELAQLPEQTIYDNFKYENVHFNELIARANELLAAIEIALGEVNSPVSSRVNSESNIQENTNDNGKIKRKDGQTNVHTNIHLDSVKLPTLKLPIFNGEPLMWRTFWQSFEPTVHNQNIPDIQKMTYLLGCLRNEAQKAVAGFPISNENYKIIVDLLRNRYGDSHTLIESLQMELLNLPNANDSTMSLRNISETIERICRQLSDLGVDENSSFIATHIKSKFPRHIISKIIEEERKSGDRWTTKQIRNAIQDIITIREEVQQCINTHKKEEPRVSRPNKFIPRPNQFNPRTNRFEQETTRAFPITNQQSKNKLPCLFCEGDHWSRDCKKVSGREDRVKRLMNLQRCFICLKEGHMASKCTSPYSCKLCMGKHHIMICPKNYAYQQVSQIRYTPNTKKPVNNTNFNKTVNFNSKPKQIVQKKAIYNNSNNKISAPILQYQEEQSHSEPVQNEITGLSVQTDEQKGKLNETFLMARKVPVFSPHNPKKILSALIFFDSGSQTSYISNKLVKKLSPPKVGERILEVNSFCSEIPTRFKSSKYRVRFELLNGKNKELILSSTDGITKSFQSVKLDSSEIDQTIESLQNSLEFIQEEPDILIGVADFWDFFVKSHKLGSKFYLIDTTVGPIVCGSTNLEKNNLSEKTLTFSSVTSSIETTLPDESQVKQFWDLETLGILDDPEQNDDEKAKDYFYKNIKRLEDGSYEVRWLWKDENPNIPSNYQMAFSRLISVINKLKSSQNSFEQYNNVFQEQIKTGVLVESDNNENITQHFLCHHPVYKLKPGENGVITKCRPVLDASARTRYGKSLNDFLYRGPVTLSSLIGLLIRVRLSPIFVLSDVQSAFHTLKLAEGLDQDVTKLLWLKDITKPVTQDNIQVYKHKKVLFGASSSPQLLGLTIQFHLSQYDTDLSREIADNIYVDNVLMTCQTVEEAKEKYTKSKRIFEEAKMNLREFVSNNDEFNQFVPKEDRLGKSNLKILGLPWELDFDHFVMKFPSKPSSSPPTRREVLSTLASIYDPLGLVSPCILDAKLIFQSLWKKSKTWDSPLQKYEETNWNKTLLKWKDQEINIHRQICFTKNDHIYLHAFVDASNNAYAATVYVICDSGGQIQSNLVYAKSRLRPKSLNLTIPKLELMSILIGLRAMTLVKKELHCCVLSETLWSDSLVALSWINIDEKQPKFIQNRLFEIRKHSNVLFKHVKTNDNPADIATRGSTPSDLQSNSLWWFGPSWLVKDPKEWPVGPIFPILYKDFENDDIKTEIVNSIQNKIKPSIETELENFRNEWIEEIKINKENQEVITSVTTVKESKEIVDLPLIDVSRFSTWKKLIKTMSYIIKFLKLYKIESECEFLDKSEKLIFKMIQQNNLKRPNPKVFRLEASSDGLLRLKTRLSKSDTLEGIKNPIFIPKKANILNLLILDIHLSFQHAGVDHVLTEFLCKYWTPQARTQVKLALRKCIRCRFMKSYPFALPEMPQLPEFRVKRNRQFQVVGLDFLGATLYKTDNGKRKAWILLITCLSTRAIHLEVVTDQTSDTFLNALRRYIARRGKPDQIFSDNQTTFQLASKTIIEVLEKSMRIKWNFIPELSPFKGGSWERLVGLVKKSMTRTIGKRTLNYDQLITFTTECEGILNTRPITAVSDDEEGFIPLRPIDFMNPEVELSLDITSADKDYLDLYATSQEKLAHRWRQTLSILDDFWIRWNTDYLLMLRSRTQWTHKGPKLQTLREPCIGEIVLIHEEFQPRNLWNMGKIVKLLGSKAIKNAVILTRKGKTISRPISKLYPLEITTNLKVDDNNPETLDENNSNDKHPSDEDDLLNNTQNQLENQPTEQDNKGYNLRKKKHLPTKFISLSIIMILFILFPLIFTSHTNSHNICPDCTVSCTKTGVQVSAPKLIDKYEVCCEGNICLTHMYEPFVEFNLSKDILAINHDCDVSFWAAGLRMVRHIIQCPATNLCELIECNFCWERLMNPDCKPYLTAIIFGIFFLIGFLTMCICLCLTRQTGANIKCLFYTIFILPFSFIIWILKCFRKNSSNEHLEEYEKYFRRKKYGWNQKWRKSRFGTKVGTLAVIILGFSILFQKVLANSPGVITIQAKSEECRNKGDKVECSIIASTIMTLLPIGQSNQIIIKNNSSNIIGIVDVVVKSLNIICLPVTEKWLRSYKFDNTKVIVYCPWTAGDSDKQKELCYKAPDQTCKPNSQLYPLDLEIPEFDKWKNFPGNIFCIPIGNGIVLQCPVDDNWYVGKGTSCVYYKNLITPISNFTYEVISCIDTDYRIPIDIGIYVSAMTVNQTSLNLIPGIPILWNDITLEILSVSLPPAPSFNHYFLYSDQSIAYLRDIPQDLFCATEESANKFNCTIDHQACMGCELDHNTLFVTCHCRNLNLEKYSHNPNHHLPITLGKHTFKYDEKTIYSETEFVPLQLYINMNKLELVSQIDESICTIVPITFSGCYNCPTGATLTYTCQTDFGNSRADVICNDKTVFSTNCNEIAIIKNQTLNFNYANVDLLCQVKCPGGDKSFNLEGTLVYLVKENPKLTNKTDSEVIYTDNNNTDNKSWFGFSGFNIGDLFNFDWNFDLSNLLKFLFRPTTFIIIITIVLIGVCILYLFSKFHPMFRGYRLISRTLLNIFMLLTIVLIIQTQLTYTHIHLSITDINLSNLAGRSSLDDNMFNSNVFIKYLHNNTTNITPTQNLFKSVLTLERNYITKFYNFLLYAIIIYASLLLFKEFLNIKRSKGLKIYLTFKSKCQWINNSSNYLRINKHKSYFERIPFILKIMKSILKYQMTFLLKIFEYISSRKIESKISLKSLKSSIKKFITHPYPEIIIKDKPEFTMPPISIPLIRFLCTRLNYSLKKLEDRFSNRAFKTDLEKALLNSISAGKVSLRTCHLLPRERNFDLKPINFTTLITKHVNAYYAGTQAVSLVQHYNRRHNIKLTVSKNLPCLTMSRGLSDPQYFPLECIDIVFETTIDYLSWGIDKWLNYSPPKTINPSLNNVWTPMDNNNNNNLSTQPGTSNEENGDITIKIGKTEIKISGKESKVLELHF